MFDLTEPLTVGERIVLAVAIKESIEGFTKLLDHPSEKVSGWAANQIALLASVSAKLGFN